METYISSFAFFMLCDKRADILLPDNEGINPAWFQNIRPNDILHVQPFQLKNIITIMLHIPCEFRVLTNFGDATLPEINMNDCALLLEYPLLTHWYVQNWNWVPHPKITQIPIGMDYLSSHPGNIGPSAGFGPTMSMLEQDAQLRSLTSVCSPSMGLTQRIPKLFCNFQYRMNSGHGYFERPFALTIPSHLRFMAPKLPRLDTWRLMSQYAFVLCPPGNGLDTHRTWEALVLGCIPVVKTSGLDTLYANLPVLIVKKWGDVTESLLTDTLREYSTKTFNYEKLTLQHWRGILSRV